MPLSIVDLGIVEDVCIDADAVAITILPTFVGCPALPMIEDDVRREVSALEGVREVRVSFVNDPPWSVDRITDAGRASLKEHGVTVPLRGGMCGAAPSNVTTTSVELTMPALVCPYCGSTDTRLISEFGPTRCRMICHCDACRNSFEHLKRVEA
jgi:ring-1,2-phenylacetyl-CoA epoxidase subunit PaaD